MHAVSVRSVHKSFPQQLAWADVVRGRWNKPPVHALQGVELCIDPGSLVGVAGPNGAGKTTLLRLIGGLLVPTSGSIRVHGVETTHDSLRRVVSYVVTEERSHFWRLSAQHNLEFFAALHGLSGADRDAAVRRALDVVDLLGTADRPVRTFSSGMRQRLALARGLLGRPKVLLLDEPTRGVDPGHAARIHSHIVDELVGRRGMTVLYATHRIEEMRDLCPRLLLIRDGRLAGDGAWSELGAAVMEAFEL